MKYRDRREYNKKYNKTRPKVITLRRELEQAKEATKLEFKRFETAIKLGANLEKQITEANKILDEWNLTVDDPESVKLLLINALQIPRKEKDGST